MNVPWPIWLVVIILGLEGVQNLLMIPQIPMAAVWLLAKILIITGLVLRWKAVFVFSLLICAYHVVVFAVAGAWGVAGTNLLLFLLTASTWSWFFPAKNTSEPEA